MQITVIDNLYTYASDISYKILKIVHPNRKNHLKTPIIKVMFEDGLIMKIKL